ncbi:uncharacterized protein LOC111331946 [Stylophora pistillata]|uniref:uncharacterized protein LOC111331946 n=1 Tax=Stylophora pistillata TaxID=50429 RepID=UPI000C03AEB5|nr:uncharacterized protein LOC111331946 [Stylophora pistillata]
MGNCWKDLGTILNVPESEVRNIEVDYFHACDKGFAVLQSWRDREGNDASVKRLVDALIEIRMKRNADHLLAVVRKEKRRQSQQKGDKSEKYQETCGSPVEVCDKEDETGKHQASEREGSSEAMSSTSEEVNASRTQNTEQSERIDETGSEKMKLDELRESLQKVREMDQAVTRIKSRVDELPRRQQSTRKNEPFEMMRSLLKEVDAFKEVIEQNILERMVRNENVEGLRDITEKVRKARIDLSEAS